MTTSLGEEKIAIQTCKTSIENDLVSYADRAEGLGMNMLRQKMLIK